LPTPFVTVVKLDTDSTLFRRRSGAALLAVVALVGWLAFHSPGWDAGTSSNATGSAISRGSDAVQQTARTSETRTEKRNTEPTVDGTRRAGFESAQQASALGPNDHHRPVDSSGSHLTARGPPTSPTV
jgi:hypothetical protein